MTITTSLKFTCTLIVSPILYVPLVVEDVTLDMVGATASTRTAVVEPTLLRVRVALVGVLSAIVPPLASMLAPTAMPSASASPDGTM